jgi:hypothetical protein
MFVELPRLCLTAVTLDVKLLRALQDVDTIFGSQRTVPVVD